MSAQSKKDQPTATDRSSSQPTYRWCYTEQERYDRQHAAHTKRSGIFIYAVTMTIVFLLCILVLIGTLIWYQKSEAEHHNGLDSAISDVSEAVNPATVLIEAVTSSGESYGTGFFLTENGYLVTNYHVIKDASEVFATLYSGERLSAELVGYYKPDDLAVLKLDGYGFSTVTIGRSSDLTVGELVIAIGNPANGEAAWTTTHGIVSALNRRIAISESYFVGTLKMLQTDAPINPGNSGGPLCNASGEVIGIVSRKLTDYDGIGFAIPMDEAMETLQAIMTGTVDQLESKLSVARPTIGITAETISAGQRFQLGGSEYLAECDGVIVTSVLSGSAAESVLEYGDLLISFDGISLSSVEKLQTLLYRYRIGDTVTIRLIRRGEQMEVTVRLG